MPKWTVPAVLATTLPFCFPWTCVTMPLLSLQLSSWCCCCRGSHSTSIARATLYLSCYRLSPFYLRIIRKWEKCVIATLGAAQEDAKQWADQLGCIAKRRAVVYKWRIVVFMPSLHQLPVSPNTAICWVTEVVFELSEKSSKVILSFSKACYPGTKLSEARTGCLKWLWLE